MGAKVTGCGVGRAAQAQEMGSCKGGRKEGSGVNLLGVWSVVRCVHSWKGSAAALRTTYSGVP